MSRGAIFAGIMLILVGSCLLAITLFPGLGGFLDISQQWPLIVIGVGGVFVAGAVLGTPGLAVPGTIIAGIGSLLYIQNALDEWGSWSYAWGLIPGFVGLGTIIMRALEGRVRDGLREGGRLVVISLVLVVVFGIITGGFLSAGNLWPLLLILLGGWILIRNLFGGGERSHRTAPQVPAEKPAPADKTAEELPDESRYV
jgi:hypothetical protein